MQTECTPSLFEFEPVDHKKVVAGFDGGTITSDAGELLLGQLKIRGRHENTETPYALNFLYQEMGPESI